MPLSSDLSVEHIRLLLPDALPELPSSSEGIRAYIEDTAGLRIPVLPKFYRQAVHANGGMAGLLTPTDDSLLPASLSILLSAPPQDHGSELTTTIGVCSYLDTVFPSMYAYSNIRLIHKIYLNMSATGTSSSVMKPRTRPDTALVASSCMLMGTWLRQYIDYLSSTVFETAFQSLLIIVCLVLPSSAVGEDKCEGGMQPAMDDIKRKLANMSPLHYGTLPFILAYTAAGNVVQFHSVFWDKTAHQVWPA